MVRLEIGNTVTEIRGEYPHETVDKVTSFYRKGYFHTPSYQSGRWDGREHLLRHRRFPSGLLTVVLAALEAKGVRYVLDDRRGKIPVSDIRPFGIDGIKLRDYQVNAIGQMLKNLRGVVQIPTGGGKTLIAGSAIKALDVPAVYIVHTSTLAAQTKEVFSRLFKESQLGEVGGGKSDWKKYTICMVQTLREMIKRRETESFLRYKALFVDECHHVHSNGAKASWYVAQSYFQNAFVRFGLSATPTLKKHGLLLQAATGPLIHKAELKELQEREFLATVQAEIHQVRVEETPDESVPVLPFDEEPDLDWEDDPTQFLREFAQDYKRYIINGGRRNLQIANLAIDHARKGDLCLVYVERRNHGKRLFSLMEYMKPSSRNPVNIRFLSGEDKKEDVKFYKNEAREKRLNVLIATRKLFGEGVDIPAVDVLINASGLQDLTAFTQLFGRGLRVTNEKTTVKYIDFYDLGSSHLERHSKERIKHLKSLGQKDIKIIKG